MTATWERVLVEQGNSLLADAISRSYNLYQLRFSGLPEVDEPIPKGCTAPGLSSGYFSGCRNRSGWKLKGWLKFLVL